MRDVHVHSGLMTVVGFLVGSILAMCLVPGDLVLAVVAGLLLGLFARAMFDSAYGVVGLSAFGWLRSRRHSK